MKHCNMPNLIQKALCTYTNTMDNPTNKEVQQTYRDHTQRHNRPTETIQRHNRPTETIHRSTTDLQRPYRGTTDPQRPYREAQQTYRDHTQRYNRSTEQSKTIKQCRIKDKYILISDTPWLVCC